MRLVMFDSGSLIIAGNKSLELPSNKFLLNLGHTGKPQVDVLFTLQSDGSIDFRPDGSGRLAYYGKYDEKLPSHDTVTNQKIIGAYMSKEEFVNKCQIIMNHTDMTETISNFAENNLCSVLDVIRCVEGTGDNPGVLALLKVFMPELFTSETV